ncbi:MAG: D-2-hydroxyacid dehydrogenase [Sphingomonadales bacterium]|nr:D-2-hydroxyacid dehydrogenase [Sphingomonadales bacterium]PIX66956.1 MAG: D-2-hydroxyacid dehydrogenase [Sphingomonadales bacterium CG_4_10_14_3_um_filter_58_15]NCO49445.1 D-2-hydroxyacid dehydrogenase [Sphingomonadales bacterium]NCP00776.1 D-2-hydroxyacid dehydrogenase [Sphingomonadales bacterium]NCP26340.1 D-2-hydroxyacid dehydrogenase [Sphingomonadales bacterium]
MTKPKAAMASLVRPLVEPHCGDLDVTWFTSTEEAMEIAPQAEIGWFDMYDKEKMAEIISAATNLKWLNSIYAGVEHFPLEQLKAQGTILTNGAGLNGAPIAEFAVMMMLAAAKRSDLILDNQRQHNWLETPPGTAEIDDSKALIIGYGGIGQQIAKKLSGFDVEVTAVRRTATSEANVIGLDDWRDRLGEFDWVFVSAPATSDTKHMFGADEFAAMKSSAWLVNVARGSLVDQEALLTALNDKAIGGAALDVTDPEPLPADHPLWDAPNCIITMHLSGTAQTRMFQRAAARFVENLKRYKNGDDMIAVADFDRGY